MVASTDNSTLKTYTLEEVAKHNSKKDVWICVDGKVYDVTNFISDHPGGPESILQHAGKDATSDFEAIHSPSAFRQLANYVIGQLPDGVGQRIGAKNSADHGGSVLVYLIPIIALLVALYFQFIAKK